MNAYDALALSIKTEILEDGKSNDHLENDLESFIFNYDCAALVELVNELIEENNKAHISNAFKLFGRSSKIETSTKIKLLSIGLNSKYLEVRDAAICAAELWNEPKTKFLLEEHWQNWETVSWLKDYTKKICDNLNYDKLIDLVKKELTVTLEMDSEQTDDPGWYGNYQIVDAKVKVFFNKKLIHEDSCRESVYCG